MDSVPTTPLRSGLPRHEQVSAWLRDQIECGNFLDNEQLPSESKLCSRFSVSRITVRRALQTLEADGLIYKRQGLGSFVRSGQMRQGFVNLTDFVDDMSAAGLSARSEIVAWEREEAGPKVALALNISEGAAVVRLDRVRLGDGDPIAFDSTWLPVATGRYIEKEDLENRSIYNVLESRSGMRVSRGRFRMEAVNAPNDIAGHLNIPWGRALLLIERTTYSESGTPVCFQMRYYRSDRVAYELVLDRGPDAASSSDKGLPLREFEPVFKPS
jgi:GntR family transcriptional regulator